MSSFVDVPLWWQCWWLYNTASVLWGTHNDNTGFWCHDNCMWLNCPNTSQKYSTYRPTRACLFFKNITHASTMHLYRGLAADVVDRASVRVREPGKPEMIGRRQVTVNVANHLHHVTFTGPINTLYDNIAVRCWWDNRATAADVNYMVGQTLLWL